MLLSIIFILKGLLKNSCANHTACMVRAGNAAGDWEVRSCDPADQCYPRFFSERLKHQAADHAESNEIFRADVEDLTCLSQQMIVCRSR